MVNPCAKFLATIVASALAARLCAAPVSAGDAAAIAVDWLGRGAAPAAKSAAPAARRAAASAHERRMRPSGAPGGAVRTCSLDGTNLFHLVALDGGGFVAVSADDSQPPILGFSSSGDFPDADPANPFWGLVGGGMRRSFAIADSTVSRPAASAVRASSASPIELAADLDDLRIGPLVQSKWNQAYVGKKKVYNYYTPNGYVCGCVATAMAQLMRFHRYPSASVKPQTFTCYIAESPTNLTMKGGTYDWDSMPLEPGKDIADNEREAIGRICYDAGVAIRMDYNMENGGQSGAYGQFAHDPLTSVFGFASAHTFFNEANPSTAISMDVVENAILANLDAGRPVLLGIIGTSEGHSILADGYGYVDGTLYCHLNMGWSGSEDYWYAVPEGFSSRFSVVSSVTYNVFPDEKGELVTGRVLDPFGNPVANARVSADITYKATRGASPKSVVQKVETSSTGHYALLVPEDIAGAYSCSIALSSDSGEWASTNAVTASVSASSSPYNIDYSELSYYYYPPAKSLNVGNSWGNDLYLAPTNAVAAVFTAFSPVAAGEGFAASFTGTPGAEYRVEWTETLSPPEWNEFVNVVVPASGEAILDLPAPEDSASRFYRVVAD